MKRFHLFAWLTVTLTFSLTLPCHAGKKLTAKQLNQLDKLGAFPTDFKVAVHDYVNVVQAQADTQKEEKKLRSQVPGLEQQATTAQAKLDALHLVLADYDHTDETDFPVLQAKMNDAASKPQERLTLAQVFVWSYPTSSHLAEAQMFLQQTQKLIADELQAEKDAAAAAAVARAKLLQRVHDRDLTLAEWTDFLGNMVQEDVIKYLGAPQKSDGYYWVYSGEYSYNLTLKQKVGLQLNFNGGRVIGVAETAASRPASTSSPSANSE